MNMLDEIDIVMKVNTIDRNQSCVYAIIALSNISCQAALWHNKFHNFTFIILRKVICSIKIRARASITTRSVSWPMKY